MRLPDEGVVRGESGERAGEKMREWSELRAVRQERMRSGNGVGSETGDGSDGLGEGEGVVRVRGLQYYSTKRYALLNTNELLFHHMLQ